MRRKEVGADALREGQDVAELLASRPPARPRPGFAARVNERLDKEAPGWLNAADWRIWTWRLVPIAVALMVMASVGAFSPSADNLAGNISRAATVDAWMGGTSTGVVPASAVFWQPSVSRESLLITVLTASPDATLGEARR